MDPRLAMGASAALALGAIAATLVWPADPLPPEPGARLAEPTPEPEPVRRKIPSRPSALPPVEEWQQSETGLGWVDLVVGEGSAPEHRSMVRVEYTGWLENGRVFDSSYKGSDPLDFVLGVGGVVKGWDEGVATMKVGGKRLLRVPPKLHYGIAGRPPRIPANQTLLFEVELVEVGPRRIPPDALPTPEAWEALESGLEYAVLEDGPGTLAEDGRTVAIEYTGWLEDGSQFDTSFNAPGPTTFELGRRSVLPGWEQGVRGMRTGERRLLKLPPELAFGARGRPPMIPPNATLMFEVELVEVR